MTATTLPRTAKPDTLGATAKLHAEMQRTSSSTTTTTTTTAAAPVKRRSARKTGASASASSGEDEGVSVASAGNVAAASSDRSEYPVYDSRHPTYLGDWPKSVPNVHDDIAIDDMDEPHLKRKHALLDRHPEITQLYGHEWRTKYITVLLVSIQLAWAYAFGAGPLKDAHWGWLVLASYVFGGTITAMFGVLVHECAHNLAFKAHFPNRILGLISNIGIVFPIAASFRRYHLEHHTFQGVHGKDPDLPLDAEWKFVRGNKVLKFLWIFCFPFLYVFRGAVMMKKPQTWELVNWAWTISTDALVYTYCGPKGLLYLFLSLWFGYGIHPGAMHFIQEHYTFEDGQETYSYYGSFNWLFMNIGYHNEHHDVTKVAWSKLPEVRRIAPELYDNIAYHTSWWKILWDFIMLDHIGPQSRLGRDFEDHKAGRATIATARAIHQQKQQQRS